MQLKIQSTFECDERKSPKHITIQLDALFTTIIDAKSLADIPKLKKLPGYRG